MTDEPDKLTVGYVNVYVAYGDLFKGRVRAVNMAQTAYLDL